MNKPKKTPSYLRRCVADVTAQGKSVSDAFAICQATMQKAGYLTPGPGQMQTAKGRKRQRHFSAMKNMKQKDVDYELALKRARNEREGMNEDGHTDVASARRSLALIGEDAAEMLDSLATADSEANLPSWWMNKLAVCRSSMNSMRDYLLTGEMESIAAPGGLVSLAESLRSLAEAADSCPLAATDLEANTRNRNRAIKADYIKYGPLNVDEPGDYWKRLAEHWDTTVGAAKKSLCGNCVAFDISPRMLECMPGETSDDDGVLGYCWMHDFKCHSARTCYTWAKGGPIEDDDVSMDWQSRKG
jgi:hypothetical protein